MKRQIGQDIVLGTVHALTPFEPILGSDFSIEAAATMLPNLRLQLDYWVQDHQQAIYWPDPAPFPLREDGLWQSTCLECFFKTPGDARYVEFNATPRRKWNLYQFDDYRQPDCLPPPHDRKIQLIELEVKHHHLKAILDLSALHLRNDHLLIGLSAVLEMTNGHKTYWALQHSGAEADFHHDRDWTEKAVLIDS